MMATNVMAARLQLDGKRVVGTCSDMVWSLSSSLYIEPGNFSVAVVNVHSGYGDGGRGGRTVAGHGLQQRFD